MGTSPDRGALTVNIRGFTLERRESGVVLARAVLGGRDGGQLERAGARGDGRSAARRVP
jgi:hypothetical protein